MTVAEPLTGSLLIVSGSGSGELRRQVGELADALGARRVARRRRIQNLSAGSTVPAADSIISPSTSTF